jgi:2-amino-4-hydroxy-6-hydroxymethyldihydropteridine diphosphokinase
MKVRAYLALGSNMGNREENLRQAIRTLHARDGIRVIAVSPIYETDPVGYVDQEAFFNMACAVETELPPESLLREVLAVEQELGRVRTIRWGPRTIDIDVLLYGDIRFSGADLQIPHPAMTERAFVLVPLRDIWEGGSLPVFNRTIEYFLEQTEDYEGVRKWGTLDWATGFGRSEN